MKSPNLVQVLKNDTDIKETILTNTIKMLTNRKLLKKEDLEKNIKSILSKDPDDMIYEIKTNSENYYVKLMLQNISTIGKATGISEFLISYKDKKNIIIVKNISKAPLSLISTRYPNTELFLEKDLMIDKVSHIFVPKFEVLREKEKEEFFEIYNLKKTSCLKISYKDPIVKYYGAKVGDVIRIIRPSESAGFAVAYRLVVKKEMF